MKDFQIRKAVPDDAEGIANVHIGSWKTTYKNIVSDEYLDSLNVGDRKVRWDGILSGPHETYVCEMNNGEISGFVSIGRERDEHQDGELYAIYLLKDYQRKGLGSSLFTFAMDTLKSQGYSNMLVWVLRDNPSKHFYYSFKPKSCKEQKIMIGDREYDEEGLLFTL
ncbi:GNAT family N-acetyltransferase [Rossellomorea aquimaris]|uniref:GNAT family N-acetyltransferase n=1 Tax=Rossellomorea aquimaris TaxID=189382 RepID=UPI001CD3F57F|nr:GNAT family N-acetyltransferase [Rossellomorea aquimaris]MCA1057178.1 GNAT family N-acetyltransferase [Rossellomorea aquimaris]